MATTIRPTPQTPKHVAAGPSAASRWLVCPASITLTRDIERPSTVYAREGSAAHAVAEMLIDNLSVPAFVVIDGEPVDVTEEMLEHGQSYANYAQMLKDSCGIFGVEKRVSLDWYFDPEPMPEPVSGTTDLFGYDINSRKLTVVDYKYGRVDVEPDSPQLKLYALGLLGELGEMPLTIDLVIVQPRSLTEPVKRHTILLSELTRWASNVLEPALKRIGAGDTSEEPGEHCKFCVRSAECSALHKKALTVAKMTFKPTPPAPSELTPLDISLVLEQAELISTWISKVRLHAEELLKNGEEVPGWKLVAKRGIRKWADEREAEEAFGDLDGAYKTELISPTQMEKLLKKNGIDVRALEPLITKESSGTTLVKADDKREEVKSITPASVFEPVLVGFKS
jgi:hypothetical protein